ncbi:MAG: hypothetical protein J6S15_01940 [Clostridia bacterium]|nr:hypothetical protein [Clostridia bacterium]
MKRLMTLLLAVVMVFCLAACAEESTDTSSTPATSTEASTEASSEAPAESSTPAEESSEAEPSTEPSEDESSEEPVLDYEVAEYITQYVSWKGSIGNGGLVGLRGTDGTSIRLTALNTGVVDGVASIVAFNSDYAESTIESAEGTYEDYEVFVMEYDHATYSYKVTASYDLEAADKDAVEIPADGYVLAIHKHFEKELNGIKATDFSKDIFYPHGFRATNDINAEIYEGTITVDGNVSADEYGDAIWVIEQSNELVSYEQFTDGNYYSTAEVYLAYDEEYLYVGVVVNSPYHINKITSANASSMYNSECIQVNVTSADPTGEYIYANWDNVVNGVAAQSNVVRQYGFCVNESGDTIKCLWMGNAAQENSETKCVRDAENQLTIYEAKIPFADCGAEGETISGTAGTVFGFSVSINSGDGNNFKNIYFRDGGGIIGLNDWSKIPTITLA